MASVLFVTAFLQHLFTFFVVQKSMFVTATAILLNSIARDWGDVVVVLFELFRSLRRFHISSTTAINNTDFREGIAIGAFLFGRVFAKLKKSRCSFDCSLNLLIFCVWFKSWRNDSLCLWFSTFRSTSWPCFGVLYPAVRLSKGVCQEFCSQRRCSEFPCNSSFRWVGPKMILRLGLVDLVDHCANSLWEQPVAIMELTVLSGRAPPSFSYVPLSQCKRRAVFRRERLHVTVFGKIEDLSLGRASNCTKLPYFESVSKCSCMARSLVSSRSRGVSPIPFSQSIGFTVVKNTASLLLLRLFPPGINPLLIMEFISLAFPTW